MSEKRGVSLFPAIVGHPVLNIRLPSLPDFDFPIIDYLDFEFLHFDFPDFCFPNVRHPGLPDFDFPDFISTSWILL